MHLNHDFDFKIKSFSDAGTFTGMAAVYNNVDQGGDKILPGAFKQTLNPPGKSFVLLYQHDPASPIGTCTLTDTSTGLKLDGTLLLSDPIAQRAYGLMKAGVIRGLSIGYQTLQDRMTEDVRELVEVKLYEVSLVTFPMNESAGVTGVKSMSQDEIAGHLRKIDNHRKAIDRHQRAMRLSLKALIGDDDPLDDDEDAPPADDPALFEANDEDDDPEDEGMSMLIAEMKTLVVQAKRLGEK
jgi:hypothetical protein